MRFILVLLLISAPAAYAEAEIPDDLEDAAQSGTLEEQLAKFVTIGTQDPGFLTEEQMSLYISVFRALPKRKRDAIAPLATRKLILQNSIQKMRTKMFETNVESLLGQTALSPQAFLLTCKRYAAAIRMFSIHVARLEYRETQHKIFADNPDKNDTERRVALLAERAELTAHAKLLNGALVADVAACGTAVATYKRQLATTKAP